MSAQYAVDKNVCAFLQRNSRGFQVAKLYVNIKEYGVAKRYIYIYKANKSRLLSSQLMLALVTIFEQNLNNIISLFPKKFLSLGNLIVYRKCYFSYKHV